MGPTGTPLIPTYHSSPLAARDAANDDSGPTLSAKAWESGLDVEITVRSSSLSYCDAMDPSVAATPWADAPLPLFVAGSPNECCWVAAPRGPAAGARPRGGGSRRGGGAAARGADGPRGAGGLGAGGAARVTGRAGSRQRPDEGGGALADEGGGLSLKPSSFFAELPSVTDLLMLIRYPHLRHFIRTERPATFSSAIWYLALQEGQRNFIPSGPAGERWTG